MKKKRSKATVLVKGLLPELRTLIHSARQTVAQAVNTGLTLLYWRVGERIRREILKEKRADYGEEIVSTLSRQLTPEFGPGFSDKALAKRSSRTIKRSVKARY